MELMLLSPKNPMRVVLLTVLCSEALAFGLAIPVMIFNAGVSADLAAGLGGGAALLALASAGVLRRGTGYYLGWLTQIAAVALGIMTTSMFVVGGMFAVIWVVSFVLGKKLDARGVTAGR